MLKPRVARGCLVACLALVNLFAHAEADPLVRSAPMSRAAAHAAQMAVARAGARLVSVGERGIVMLSDDDGLTWRQAAVPVSVTLTKVQFPTARQGWAVGHGGLVLHSADGGQTWSRQLDGAQAAGLVLAAAARVASRGTDGEAARRQLADAQRLVAEGADKPLLDVLFRDEKHGIVVGAYGLILATEDGGLHWQSWSDRIPNPESKHLYGIGAAGGHLFIVGEQGALFRSDDEGRTFSELASPYAGSYFGVIARDPGEVFVYGLRGHAFVSSDAGATWTAAVAVGGAPVSFSDGVRLRDGFIVVTDLSGQVFGSADGGRTLRLLPTPFAIPLFGVTERADGGLELCGLRGDVHASPTH